MVPLQSNTIVDELLRYINTSPVKKEMTDEIDKIEQKDKVKPHFSEGYQLDSMRTFNLLFFTDSLKRFVESLDYFVIAFDFLYNVFTYERPLKTL